MQNEAMEEAHQEELHRLYYNLQHYVLPNIILSEQVDNLLKPNPAGEGLLSEAGKTEPAHLTTKAIAEDELEKHIAEQEEKRIELEGFDFYDEVPDFLSTADQQDDDYLENNDLFAADNENAADADFLEDDDPFGVDDEFDDDLSEDDQESEEDDEELSPQMLQLMAELNEMLELHKVKAGSSNPDENFLDDTWREAWFDTELELLPDRAGYTIKRINQQGYEIVLFTFPEPIQIIDAYMAAAIRKPGAQYRYYTLEATVSEDEDTAVLAEWKTGRVHCNTGRRTTDVRNGDAFLEWIFQDLNRTIN